MRAQLTGYVREIEMIVGIEAEAKGRGSEKRMTSELWTMGNALRPVLTHTVTVTSTQECLEHQGKQKEQNTIVSTTIACTKLERILRSDTKFRSTKFISEISSPLRTIAKPCRGIRP
ncbi:hypothetical protein VNO78_03481 [Psophocarpus tetragonolobus]|uniref:Uncharacterized protein n=1 Tax=Psophocarpus tetragonolobus TaxID=3891 RepID=A0AAN9XVM2_PSOTE